MTWTSSQQDACPRGKKRSEIDDFLSNLHACGEDQPSLRRSPQTQEVPMWVRGLIDGEGSERRWNCTRWRRGAAPRPTAAIAEAQPKGSEQRNE